ncbi:branched-chain amino acid transport system substrate-binding protein [Thalassospira sp. MBR-102]|uniref:ABC transporter substrate-binding protein n=2 Tax=Thalassospira TaxID=168934 RepID=A0A154KZW7_9PROT|nr:MULTISPECIES: ABC transporter substrate-binding protein [Thalassospira]KZB55855.1 ABC transporter substrate-binding protein [Thalassospira xiamenensis]KZB60522.1 ABC transporter substrate-binding protein [Thalassospira lucentensis]MAZ34074.1 ABC transporter substrate-binding protein [Thalassospira sp.]MCH2276639.1 ABC transporter substrate-binding protein [Thalassospira sp.]OSQ28489.1 ABC transporter substrate-binding protein [Thalassospira sp. MCCC 1A03138]
MKGTKTTIAALAALLMAGAAQAEPVKVGMITTLSGGGAGLGIDARDGFMLAVKQANNPDLTVVIEDDQQKPDIAVQLADKMIQSEKVDVLTGIIWSNLAMAVVPSAVAQDKFYLSVNAAPSQLAGKGCNKNYFSVSYQNDNLHEAAGGYATSAGYEKTFVMAPNYPAGKDSIAGFKRFYLGDVSGEVYTKLGQTDYAAEIAQIRASGADSVFFFLPGGMGIAFMKQYAQSGVDIPLIGPAFSLDQGILGAIGDAAIGIKNTANWSKDIDNDTNKAFVETFQAEYGRLPSIYASYGFDTANLLLSAMGKADVKDADAFRDALRAADFNSVRGKFIFGPNQHPIQDIYVREVVKEGDVLTNKIIGTALIDHADAYASECAM